jgi:hypothetical protein
MRVMRIVHLNMQLQLMPNLFLSTLETGNPLVRCERQSRWRHDLAVAKRRDAWPHSEHSIELIGTAPRAHRLPGGAGRSVYNFAVRYKSSASQ